MLFEAIEIKQHGWEEVCDLEDFKYSLLYKSVTFNSNALVSNLQRTKIRGVLFAANIFLQDLISVNLSIMSIGFSYDLIRTIQNPFGTYVNRLRKIWISIFYIDVALVLYKLFCQAFNPIHSEEDLKRYGLNFQQDDLVRPWILLINTIELFIMIRALYISIKSIKNNQGLNKEVKRNIYLRQIGFVAVRTITNTPLYLLFSVTLVNDIRQRMQKYPLTEFTKPNSFNEFGQAVGEASGCLYFLIIV